MDQIIKKPHIVSKRTDNALQTIGGEGGYPNGSNSFLASSLVVLTSGNLIQIATAAVLVAGIVPDPSHPAGIVNPPTAFFADKHWPFMLQGVQFNINIGTLSSTAAVVGQANSAKQISDVTIGTAYGVAVATTGQYAGYEFLDPTNTTNKLFTVVGIPSLRGVAPGNTGGNNAQTSATYNGIVTVELYAGTIQTLS